MELIKYKMNSWQTGETENEKRCESLLWREISVHQVNGVTRQGAGTGETGGCSSPNIFDGRGEGGLVLFLNNFDEELDQMVVLWLLHSYYKCLA